MFRRPSARSAKHRVESPLSPMHATYEWIVLVLLLACVLVGTTLFGAVRMWSVGGLMTIVYTSGALYFLGQLLFPQTREKRWPLFIWCWLGFVILSWVFIAIAPVVYDAKVEALRVGSYVTCLLILFSLLNRPHRWRIVLIILMVWVSMLSWYAIIQHAHGSREVLMLTRPEGYGMRASATYICPNHFGNLAAMMMTFAVSVLLMPRGHYTVKIIGMYTCLVCAPALFLTLSRSAWLSLMVGLIVVCLLHLFKKSKKWFFCGLAALPAVAAGFIGLLWFISSTFRNRVMEALPTSPENTTVFRLILYKDTWDMITEAPLFGHGANAYRYIYPQFKTFTQQLWARYAHNEMLHSLAEIGWLGTGFLLICIGITVGYCLRGYLKNESGRETALLSGVLGVIAVSVTHSLFDYNFHLYSNNLVLIILVSIGLVVSRSEVSKRPIKGRRLRFPAKETLFIIVMVALIGLTVQAHVSDTLRKLGENRRKELNYPASELLMRRAVDWDPSNWNAQRGLADVLRTQAFWNRVMEVRTQQIKEADHHYREALRLNPYSLEVYFGLAKMAEKQSRQQEAAMWLEKATALDTHNAYYYGQLGFQLKKMEDYPKALEAFKKALQFDYKNEAYQLNIRWLQKKLAEQNDA